jgi:hypothetical protein
MPQAIVAIPEKDLNKLLPQFVHAFYEGVEGEGFPDGWMAEEIRRFKKENKHKLSHGQYRMKVAEVQKFAYKSFESLVNHTIVDMQKDGEVELGVDADGDMIVWEK